jgi:hypothetical protein
VILGPIGPAQNPKLLETFKIPREKRKKGSLKLPYIITHQYISKSQVDINQAQSTIKPHQL